MGSTVEKERFSREQARDDGMSSLRVRPWRTTIHTREEEKTAVLYLKHRRPTAAVSGHCQSATTMRGHESPSCSRRTLKPEGDCP